MVSFSVFIQIPIIAVWWAKCWGAYHERSYSWPKAIKFSLAPPSYNGILLPVKERSGSNWQIYNHESSNHECCNDSERSEVTKYHCRFHRRRVPDGEVFTNTQRNTQENIKYSQTSCELHLGRHVTLEDGILKMAVHSASTAVRITSDRVVVMSGANVQKFHVFDL